MPAPPPLPPEADEGYIDHPIGRCPPPSLLRRVDPAGKTARTRFRVLERGAISQAQHDRSLSDLTAGMEESG